MSADTSIAARFGSGAAVRRIEDPALVQGQGPALDFLSARFNYLPVFGNC